MTDATTSAVMTDDRRGSDQPIVEAPPVTAQLKKAGWYLLLTVLALVILYPLYMSLMRALSDPAAYARAGNPPWPVNAEWDVFSRAWNGGNLKRNRKTREHCSLDNKNRKNKKVKIK